MADAAIAANILQTLDVQGDFCAELTFHRIFVFEEMTNLTLFFFSQVVTLLVLVDAQLSTDLISGDRPTP